MPNRGTALAVKTWTVEAEEEWPVLQRPIQGGVLPDVREIMAQRWNLPELSLANTGWT